MITRSIYIGNPAYLKLKDEQMKILCPETKTEKGVFLWKIWGY
jgi:CRISPR-associated protein Cas1